MQGEKILVRVLCDCYTSAGKVTCPNEVELDAAEAAALVGVGSVEIITAQATQGDSNQVDQATQADSNQGDQVTQADSNQGDQATQGDSNQGDQATQGDSNQVDQATQADQDKPTQGSNKKTGNGKKGGR